MRHEVKKTYEYSILSITHNITLNGTLSVTLNASLSDEFVVYILKICRLLLNRELHVYYSI